MKTISALCGMLLYGLMTGQSMTASAGEIKVYSVAEGTFILIETVQKTDAEWRAILTPEQYYVLRNKGTEDPFSGRYDMHHEHGVYRCAGCALDLYSSKDKYDSGSGWPSFTAPVAGENIATPEERGLFKTGSELLCARCGGHLGHVFDDGPPPTGKRHCINSAALVFVASG